MKEETKQKGQLAAVGTKVPELLYLEKEIEKFLANKKGEDTDVLVIGEREGEENVIQTVLLSEQLRSVKCVDISPIKEGGPLQEIIEQNNKISFEQCDFVENKIDEKFDIIVCISVLEHFGMKFNEQEHSMFEGEKRRDQILWNYDLDGMLAMSKLLRDNDSVCIITLPIGPFMNYFESGFPFLRYYDQTRRNVIGRFCDENNITFSERFFVSPLAPTPDEAKEEVGQSHMMFTVWREFNESIFTDLTIHYNGTVCAASSHHPKDSEVIGINPMTPNAIWGLTLQNEC